MIGGMDCHQSHQTPTAFQKTCREAFYAAFWMLAPFAITAAVTAAVFHPMVAILVACCGGAAAVLWLVKKINQIDDPRHAKRPRDAP
jgi:hypothetical protein